MKTYFFKLSLKVFFIFYFIMLTITVDIVAQNTAYLQEHWWQPDGTVNAVVRDGNTVYLGGIFSSIAPSSEPYGASISASSGIPDITFLNPNAEVHTSIPDGSGGGILGASLPKLGISLVTE
ncbi:MAG: hypothetical protein EA412_04860 [Chitinophagaceae bacterium]|nr:MAG: hypothetical protein EA412_04860 [Chitinophagaceae bacterium]